MYHLPKLTDSSSCISSGFSLALKNARFCPFLLQMSPEMFERKTTCTTKFDTFLVHVCSNLNVPQNHSRCPLKQVSVGTCVLYNKIPREIPKSLFSELCNNENVTQTSDKQCICIFSHMIKIIMRQSFVTTAPKVPENIGDTDFPLFKARVYPQHCSIPIFMVKALPQTLLKSQ